MNKNEFSKRRRQLMRMMGRGAIAIVSAASEQMRNRDVEYRFRQNSDFQYLTGFPEPDAVAVLIPARQQAEYIVFCRERDPKKETWTGRRAGSEGACRDYGADDAFPIDDIDDILPGLLEPCQRVFFSLGTSQDFDTRVIGWINHLRRQNRDSAPNLQEIVSLDHFLHDMRLYKSRSELATMRKAARVSIKAHERALSLCRPGINEYEIEAELGHEFRRNGARSAYGSIVGSGANSCILHYTQNDQTLADGDLLLIDAACEMECYASDITRTLPVNGRFTAAQLTIYELVLKAQLAAIDAVRVGNHWNQPHEAAVRVLTKGLCKLGLLEGTPSKRLKDEDYRKFYMHRTGHWLGLDVHDVGDYKVDGEWRELEPGMVLTVEPGLYIPAGLKKVARRWWNIGVRIEDDVLVTKGDPDVLTDKLIKRPDDIEEFMRKRAA